jgi:hypothetical protein
MLLSRVSDLTWALCIIALSNVSNVSNGERSVVLYVFCRHLQKLHSTWKKERRKQQIFAVCELRKKIRLEKPPSHNTPALSTFRQGLSAFSYGRPSHLRLRLIHAFFDCKQNRSGYRISSLLIKSERDGVNIAIASTGIVSTEWPEPAKHLKGCGAKPLT